ncbi:MAG: hypothetical protein EBU45_03330, partial [Actinobacteria bacterium]|nr:hypothetical protein [Actinomycetota bacterium]
MLFREGESPLNRGGYLKVFPVRLMGWLREGKILITSGLQGDLRGSGGGYSIRTNVRKVRESETGDLPIR